MEQLVDLIVVGLQLDDAAIDVDGNVADDIAVLEDRKRFLAVLQGGVIKAGRLAAQACDTALMS